jgi:peptide/nickel transport system permease protein
MLGYLLRRTLYGLLTVLGVIGLLFVLFFGVASPDDIARKALGERAAPAALAQWKKNHGYDRPLFLNLEHGALDASRYTDTLLFQQYRSLLTFDFGRSDADDTPILERIRSGAGPSLTLALPLFVLEVLLAVALSLAVAFFRETYIDRMTAALCVLAMSLGTLIYIIAGQFLLGKLLRWFPISGFDADQLVVLWRFLGLPVAVGLAAVLGSETRFYRTVFVEEVYRDYVRTARAKGCGEAKLMFRHVLGNAMLPILSRVVTLVPFLFLGGLLLENFFGIPGLGSLTVDAINGNDLATLRALVFVSALLLIAAQLVLDVAYTLVDPRVRLT